MAAAHDTHTRFPATENTTDATAGTRTFTHTPVGTPAGVVVMLCGTGTAQLCTGVSYGGVKMRRIVGSTDTTEAGTVDVWVLDQQTVPTGAQTVSIFGATTAPKFVTCCTLTSATNYVRVAGLNYNFTTSANPTLSLSGGSGALMSYMAIHTGAAAPSTSPNAGTTLLNNRDYGALAAQTIRRTTASAGAHSIGVVLASDDWAAAAVTLEEWTPPDGTTLGYQESGLSFTGEFTTASATISTFRVKAGGNRVLVVEITGEGDGGGGIEVNSVTWGGTNLVKKVEADHPTWSYAEVWMLANPAEGVQDLVITLSGANQTAYGVYAVDGADQTDIIRTDIVQVTGSGTSASDTIGSCVTTDLIHALVAVDATGHFITESNSLVYHWEQADAGHESMAARKTGESGTVTVGFTWTGSNPYSFCGYAIAQVGTMGPAVTEFAAVVAAVGAISVDAVRTRALVVPVAGQGAVSPAMVKQAVLAAVVAGQGAVSAAHTPVRGLAATVSGQGQVAVSIEKLAGAIIDLAAAVQGLAQVQAGMGRILPVSASVAGQGTVSAVLARERALAVAQVQGAAAVVAALARTRALTVDQVSGAGTVSAVYVRQRALAAAAAALGAVSVDLSIGGVVDMAALVQAQGQIAAALAAARSFSAQVSGSGDVQAALGRLLQLEARVNPNRIRESSFEGDISNHVFESGTVLSLTQDSEHVAHGALAMKISTNQVGGFLIPYYLHKNDLAGRAGVFHTFSAYVWSDVSDEIVLQIRERDSGNAQVAVSSVTYTHPGGGWQRRSVSWMPHTFAVSVSFEVYRTTSVRLSNTIWVDALQFEEGLGASPFHYREPPVAVALARTRSLAATVAAQGTVAGQVDTGAKLLAAVVAAQGSVVVDFGKVRSLEAAVQAVASIQVTLGRIVQLAAEATGMSQLAVQQAIVRGLQAPVAGQGTLAAQITGPVKLNALVAAVGQVAASLQSGRRYLREATEDVIVLAPAGEDSLLLLAALGDTLVLTAATEDNVVLTAAGEDTLVLVGAEEDEA